MRLCSRRLWRSVPTVERSDRRGWFARVAAADKEAFRELVERYQRKILAVAMGMVHNRDDALELTQGRFVKAYENLDRFKGESSFYTWLYRIVVNLGIDFRRRDRAARHCVCWRIARAAAESSRTTLPGSAPERSVSARRAHARSASACSKRSTS